MFLFMVVCCARPLERVVPVRVQVRAAITRDAGKALAKAATIATRYSILRRQGFREAVGGRGPGRGEHQVQVDMIYQLLLHYRWAVGVL